MISDTRVPNRDLLLGSEAVELLNLALENEGGRCRRARPSQVRYQPGSSVTVQYEALVEWGSSAAVPETLVAQVAPDLPDNTVRLDAGGSGIAVWRYPNDPYLPGLGAAVNPSVMTEVFEELGVASREVRLRRRAYRPGRRAVVEAISPEARLFVKVVRPSRVHTLQEIHRLAAGQIPVPHSMGWDESLGLVVIQAMDGVTLRRAIDRGDPDPPGAPGLLELLHRLDSVTGLHARKPAPLSRVSDHHQLIGTVMPSLEERLSALAERLPLLSDDDAAIHGDFHTSQVIVDGGVVSGLIDLDTLGLGSRADDLATMVGQVSTLALDHPVFGAYGASLVRDFDQVVDPTGLRYRTAAVVVGFATGPFRVQMTGWERETERRVALAEQWLQAAEGAKSS